MIQSNEDIIVIENFFDKELYDTIMRSCDSPDMNWYYNSETTVPRDELIDDDGRLPDGRLKNWHIDSNTQDSAQFTHAVNLDQDIRSNFNDILEPYLYNWANKSGIGIERICRIKFNSLIKDSGYPEGFYNIPHIDSAEPDLDNWSLLVYLNDADGETVFFDEITVGKESKSIDKLVINKKLKPKANTAVLFYSGRWHASTPPKETPRRLIISYVFIRE